MKRQKICKFVSMLLTVSLLLIFTIVPSAEGNPFAIPERSVEIYTGSGIPVTAQINQTLPAPLLTLLYSENASWIQQYNLSQISNPTNAYNCHSYAWYNRYQNNNIWLNEPGAFKDDGYRQVDSTEWQPGDIIVYRDFEDGSLKDVHSAVIISVENSSLSGVTVHSKWGACALFSHRGNEVPYNTNYCLVYRCEHLSYEYIGSTSSSHIRNCNYCDKSEIVAHHFTSHTSISVYSHKSYCDQCENTYTVEHTLSGINICIVCGGKGVSASINSQDVICEEK